MSSKAEIILIKDAWGFLPVCKSLVEIYTVQLTRFDALSAEHARLKAGLSLLKCRQILDTNFDRASSKVLDELIIYAEVSKFEPEDKIDFNGFIIAAKPSINPDGVVFIRRLVSSPIARKGIGSELMEQIVNDFPLCSIDLKSLSSSLGFYEKLGFQLTGKASSPDDGIPMRIGSLRVCASGHVMCGSMQLPRWYWDEAHKRFRVRLN